MKSPYATAQEVREQLDKSSSASDPQIDAIILAVGDAIDQYCRRGGDGFVANETPVAREFPGSGQHYIQVDDFIAVTLVETRNSISDSYASWESTDWQPFAGGSKSPTFGRTPYNGILALQRTYSFFPRQAGLPLVRITAKWGYAETVPDSVKQACIIETARFFSRAGHQFADSIGNTDFGMLQYRKQLDPDVQFMLMGLRRL